MTVKCVSGSSTGQSWRDRESVAAIAAVVG